MLNNIKSASLHTVILSVWTLIVLIGHCKGLPEHQTVDSIVHIQNCTEFNYSDAISQTCGCMNLQKLLNVQLNFSQISISSGSFCLSTPFVIQDFSNFSLKGDSEATTVITCHWSDKKGAGIVFKNCTNVTIENLTIHNCGVLHNSTSFDSETNSILKFRTAIMFQKIKNLQLVHVSTIDSNGVGITMCNVIGHVLLYSCSFKNNFVHDSEADNSMLPGGGGLYVEFNNSQHYDQNLFTPGIFEIQNCEFEHNNASTERVHPKHDEFRTFGQGGGMLVCFRGTATKHRLSVSNSHFVNNSAVWGGGIHVIVTDCSHNNTVLIQNSNISSNRAKAGGGGMTIYMISRNSCQVFDNIVECENCYFIENRADEQGGGTIILTRLYNNDYEEDIHNMIETPNFAKYTSCIFRSNQAKYSAAVDVTTRLTISEPFGIKPVFKNCSFLGNSIFNKFNTIDGINAKSAYLGKAVFMAVVSEVTFQDVVVFRDNNGTALYFVASKIILDTKTQAKFEDNIGVYGGAIALQFSYISVANNSYLTFSGNKAYELGGAIYSYSLGEHQLHQHLPVLNCFLQCNDCTTRSKKNNVTLEFKHNSVTAQNDNVYSNGNSIYATSLASCASETVIEVTTQNVSAILDSVANFKFINSSAHYEVTTSAYEFTLSEQPEVYFIPGKEEDVPVVSLDFLGHKLQSEYQAYIVSEHCENGSMTIDTVYENLPNHKLKIYGDSGATCPLFIARNGYQLLYVKMMITLSECPPGYVLNKEKNDTSESLERKLECTCAYYYDEHYRGIQNCNTTQFQSKILHGFWAGYESDNASQENLVTANCPLNFCVYNYNNSTQNLTRSLYLLPDTANKALLDNFICEKGRKGKICGKCLEGHSVYYHSPHYLCKENYLCSYSVFFYVLSELLPLTALFAITLKFNISFTSGALNGFLLYAQVIDVLLTRTLNKAEYHEVWTFNMIKSLIFIYRFFNLNFFTLDELSFCLWESASTFDIITIKFATIAFAFILVLSVFVFMNVCAPKLKGFSRGTMKRSESVIHGISTFLVICFAQTVQVSFHIFTPSYMYQRGNKWNNTPVAWYNGEIVYFSEKHLGYVVPAMLAIIIVAIIPTLYLLWYPLGTKMLHKCHISETRFAKQLERILFINRLKPLLDSFQGCYKDNARCFAGLSFIYRAAVIASFSFSTGITQFYVLCELTLVIMLLLHSLAHPYKSPIHNALDSLLYADLALLNGLSIYIHAKRLSGIYYGSILASEIFQVILTAVPLICVLVYAIVKLISRLKCKSIKLTRKNNNRTTEMLLNDDFSNLLDSNRDSDYSDFESVSKSKNATSKVSDSVSKELRSCSF